MKKCGHEISKPENANHQAGYLFTNAMASKYQTGKPAAKPISRNTILLHHRHLFCLLRVSFPPPFSLYFSSSFFFSIVPVIFVKKNIIKYYYYLQYLTEK